MLVFSVQVAGVWGMISTRKNWKKLAEVLAKEKERVTPSTILKMAHEVQETPYCELCILNFKMGKHKHDLPFGLYF
jgi:hypothetical protein